MKDIYRYIRVLIIRLFALLFAKKEMESLGSALILAPHPDDEVFGCAGLIQRMLSEGKRVDVVILTGGEGAYPQELTDRETLIEQRKQLTLNAAKQIGLPQEQIYFLQWADGQLDKALISSEKIKELTGLVTKIKPEAIFSPHSFEGWSDHLATSQLADSIIHSHNSRVKNYKYNVWTWYSMPYNKLPQMGWKQSFVLQMNKKEYQRKLDAIDEYIRTLTSFGKPYSGDLPGLFVKANRWRKELYFETKD